MKTAEYKLAGDIPEAIRSTKDKVFTIKTREAESLDEMHQLVENGDANSVLRLAQAQYDIIVQRKIRDAASSTEVADMLAGKKVKIGDAETDYGPMTEDERIAAVLEYIQTEVADTYLYGARAATNGGVAKAGKVAVQKLNALQAAAANDPQLAARLAELGIV